MLKEQRPKTDDLTKRDRPKDCREDESSSSRKPEGKFRARPDSRNRSGEGSPEMDPPSQGIERGLRKSREAVALATYYLSCAPRAAERGFA